jgi:hypothetical protein
VGGLKCEPVNTTYYIFVFRKESLSRPPGDLGGFLSWMILK